MKREKQASDSEGGHMNSAEGRVTHDPNAELAFVAVLDRPRSGNAKNSFATMREAEAFIKANTPVSHSALSALYDRSASKS